MKYLRFEDLPVWNAAVALKLGVDELCKAVSGSGMSNWIDQLDRAALSISNNIAEGFARGTTNELLMFLYIARGSAGEVRSMLQYALRRPDLSNLKSQISNLIAKSESISRQLRAWAQSLQETDIKGQRFLTEVGQRSYQRRRRADALWQNSKREHEERLRNMLSRSQNDPKEATNPGEEAEIVAEEQVEPESEI